MWIDENRTQRMIGRLTWAAAWTGLALGQLHALARHRTIEGKLDLDSSLTSFWAEPAADLLSPLVRWGSPDAVYLTYGKLWLPLFAVMTLCAFVVRRRRSPYGLEKWGWRLALAGYVAATVCVAAQYWTMMTAVNDTVLDPVFLATIPAILLTVIGSTVLGIALLRGDRRSGVRLPGVRLPGALLTAAIPGLVVIPMFTSLGNVILPMLFAFGVWGHRIAREPVTLSEVAQTEHAA